MQVIIANVLVFKRMIQVSIGILEHNSLIKLNKITKAIFQFIPDFWNLTGHLQKHIRLFCIFLGVSNSIIIESFFFEAPIVFSFLLVFSSNQTLPEPYFSVIFFFFYLYKTFLTLPQFVSYLHCIVA